MVPIILDRTTIAKGHHIVTRALRSNPEDFVGRTFQALGFDPAGDVPVSITTMVSGHKQIVHLVSVKDGPNFVVKSARDQDLVDDHHEGMSQLLLANYSPDFNTFEFRNLQACAQLSDGVVAAPFALTMVETGNDQVSVYSQKYRPEWVQVGPLKTSGEWIFDLVADKPADEWDHTTQRQTKAIVSTVVREAALIYLRSNGQLLPFPIYGIGDVVIDNQNRTESSWVGLAVTYQADKLLTFHRKSGLTADEFVCYILHDLHKKDAFLPPVFNGDKVHLHLGYEEAFIRGIMEAYNTFYGSGRHTMTRDTISRITSNPVA
ncbi:MAG: hypothetical protein ABIE84_03335 [bacterium]